MNPGFDLNTIILIIVGALVTWSLKGITSINRTLNQLNGRMGKTETWQEQHTKLDDERNDKVERTFESIWSQLNKS